MAENNIEVIERKNCVGCGACISVCPKDCISLQTVKGFCYPKINADNCIQCGRCLNVCSANDDASIFNKPIEWFAGYVSENMSQHSTSGGICTELSRQYIEAENSVYSATFDANWNLVHRKIKGLEELEEFSGSKYLQSRIDSEVYHAIEQDLCEGKKCLFIGTPCQVAAINKYMLLKKVDTTLLITVDFMCHGVPSPIIAGAFIKELDQNKKISYYNFRSKEFGWGTIDRTVEYCDGKRNTISANTCPLHSWFGHHLSIREACFVCKYRRKERASDITVADFWNMEKYYPEIPKRQGVSAIQINTEKGKKEYFSMLEKCKLFSKKVSEESIWNRKTALSNFPKPISYEAFWKDAESIKIKDLIKKYPPQSRLGYFKEKVKLILRRIKNG